MTRIAAISGSLRKASYNTALIRAAQQVAPSDLTITAAGIGDIPLYDNDLQAQGFPASVTLLAEAINAADGVLIATPEYNYSIPGVLKNAIDWLSRLENQPFAGKPVALMGASMGAQGTSRAQYHLRQVFVFLDARVMNRPEVFVGAAHTKIDEAGNLVDESTREFMGRYLESLANWVEAAAVG